MKPTLIDQIDIIEKEVSKRFKNKRGVRKMKFEENRYRGRKLNHRSKKKLEKS